MPKVPPPSRTNPPPLTPLSCGEALVAHLRAHATPGGMTTDEIMAITRGDPDDDPPPT